MLWTSAEAAAATGGRAVGRWTVNGVTSEVGLVRVGDLFVADLNTRADPAIIEQAYAAGATAVLAERRYGEGPALVAPNAVRALEALAQAARDRTPARRVAVATTGAEAGLAAAVAHVLYGEDDAYVPGGRLGDTAGVALALAGLPRSASRVALGLELHATPNGRGGGVLEAPAGLIHPHIAVLSSLSGAVADGFASGDDAADAASALFSGVHAWGAAVIPGDEPWAGRLGERAGAAGAGWLVRYGADPQAEASLQHFEAAGAVGEGRAVIFGRPVSFRTPNADPAWGLRATAALAAAYLADVPLDVAAEALAALPRATGWGEIQLTPYEGGWVTVLCDAGTSDGVALHAALASLARRQAGPGARRLAVLELAGLDPVAEADVISTGLDRQQADLVFLVGAGAEALYDSLPEERRTRCILADAGGVSRLRETVRAGDVVLVLGPAAAPYADAVSALR